MRRRDSFLHLLVRLGIHESHPELAERLATEDIVIPDMRHTIAFAELMHPAETSHPNAQAHATNPSAESPAQPEEQSPKPSKWASRTRRSLTTPLQRLKDWYRNEVLAAMDEPPELIRPRFAGLTDLERRFAFESGGIGAALAGNGHHEELSSWLTDTAQRNGIVVPRLVIVESDLPVAAMMKLPGEVPAVFVGSNLLDILNERQVKAVIGHELGHLKEYQRRGVVKTIIHNWYDNFRGSEPSCRAEYRADAFAARISGGPEDMVDALRIMEERLWELQHFAKQVAAVIDEMKLNAEDVLPRGLRCLPELAKERRRIFPEPSVAEQRRATAANPHPPTVSRFDALFEADRSSDRKSPER